MSVVAKAEQVENLYRLLLFPPRVVPSVQVTARASAGSVDTTMLWHSNLGHLHESKLLKLSRASSMYRHPVPPFEQLTFCESCAKGKLKQLSYSHHSAYRARELLELVHTDLCGPVSTPSLAGSLYFMPIVDDYSRMTFVYYLKRKSEALSIFRQYVTMDERQTGKLCK